MTDAELDPTFFDDIEDDDDFSTPEIGINVVGLLNVGHLSQEFTWHGHTFLMETPCLEEEITADQIASKYSGTLAQGKALYAAQVAACLRLVDGSPIYVALESNESPSIRIHKQFDFIVKKYKFAVVEVLYSFWKQLEAKQQDALLEFQGK